MNKPRIELNHKGIREYLRSPSVQGALQGEADRIARASGPGYEAGSKVGRNRALANVRATSIEARIDNSRNATLLKNARSTR